MSTPSSGNSSIATSECLQVLRVGEVVAEEEAGVAREVMGEAADTLNRITHSQGAHMSALDEMLPTGNLSMSSCENMTSEGVHSVCAKVA